MFSYVLISKTVGDVVSLADMKTFLRIDGTDEDVLIQSIIDASVAFAEGYMCIDLLNATYEGYFDGYLCEIVLRRGKFNSLTKVEVLNDDDEYEETTDYTLRNGRFFGTLCDIDISNYECDGIKATFVAGFGTTASSVPDDIKLAIMQNVAFLYSNRGDCDALSSAAPPYVTATYNRYRAIDIFI